MPRFEVEGPDGHHYEVEADDEAGALGVFDRNMEVSRGVKGELEPRMQNMSGMEIAGDVAKSLGSGMFRGGTELAMLPATALRLTEKGGTNLANAANAWIDNALGHPGRREPQPLRMQSVWDAQDDLRGVRESVLHQSETGLGDAAETVGEFLGPGGALRAPVRLGVVPALASEAAGQATEGTKLEPIARIAGAFVGGGIGALAGSPRTAAAAIAKSLPAGMTRQDIAGAELIMRSAEAHGLPLTWPEALAKTTNGRVDIRDIQRWVEQAPRGRQVMSEFMSGRPEQVRTAVARGVERLSDGARMTDPTRAGLRIQRASGEALTNIRQRINTQTEKYYQQSANTPIAPETFDGLMRDELFADAVSFIRQDKVWKRMVEGVPDNSVGMLDAVKKYFDRRANNAASPINPDSDNFAASVYGGQAREARTEAVAADPLYEQALQRQAQQRQGVLEPAQEGQLGQMAGTSDLGDQGSILLRRDPLEGSQHEVAQTVRRLARTDPDVAFQLVRTHVKRVADEASRAKTSGPNAWAGGDIVSALRGNAQQATNLEAAVRALPDGDMRWKGMQELLDVLEASGMRLKPNSATEPNRLISEAMGRGGVVGEAAAAALSPSRLLGKAGDLYETWRRGLNSEQVARILTEPKSAILLRQLVGAKTFSEKQRFAGLLFYGTVEGLSGQIPGMEQRQALAPPR